jgi:hypothetical protein
MWNEAGVDCLGGHVYTAWGLPADCEWREWKEEVCLVSVKLTLWERRWHRNTAAFDWSPGPPLSIPGSYPAWHLRSYSTSGGPSMNMKVVEECGEWAYMKRVREYQNAFFLHRDAHRRQQWWLPNLRRSCCFIVCTTLSWQLSWLLSLDISFDAELSTSRFLHLVDNEYELCMDILPYSQSLSPSLQEHLCSTWTTIVKFYLPFLYEFAACGIVTVPLFVWCSGKLVTAQMLLLIDDISASGIL